MKKKSKLELAQEQVESAIQKTNDRITVLGQETSFLSDKLIELQEAFDDIRNMPSETVFQCEEYKRIRLEWSDQAKKIERDFKNATAKNAGKGAAGLGVGVAVMALGPTAAMGIATTFGVASTGTAISTLSGAAATNAALAWLGGGALVAGGGGMSAGSMILSLAGPVGIAIAGVSLLGSGLLLLKNHKDKKRLEHIFSLISERDVASYELARIELDERIKRVHDEQFILNDAIQQTKSFGLDYNQMTEEQQYSLGSYVNLMLASTQLLVNPILGLQPKYCETDYYNYTQNSGVENAGKTKDIVISLANMLCEIKMDEKDKKVLWKTLRKNKVFLSSMGIEKKEFDSSLIDRAQDALECKGFSNVNKSESLSNTALIKNEEESRLKRLRTRQKEFIDEHSEMINTVKNGISKFGKVVQFLDEVGRIIKGEESSDAGEDKATDDNN